MNFIKFPSGVSWISSNPLIPGVLGAHQACGMILGFQRSKGSLRWLLPTTYPLIHRLLWVGIGGMCREALEYY